MQDQHETRYWLLEPIRQYAHECLQASGEEEETRLRHARHCLAFAEHTAVELEGKSEQLVWLNRIERTLAIRRALNDTRGIASSLNNLGVIARDRRDAARTMELCHESLTLFRAIGDHHRAAIVLISLGMAASEQGNHEQARAWYEESLEMFRNFRDEWHTAWLLTYLADAMVRQGDFAAARPTAEESLVLHRKSNDAWGIARTLGIQGKVAQVDNDLETAARRFAEALNLLVGAGVERGIPVCLEDLAGIMVARGQPELAARLAGGAEALRERIGTTQSVGEGAAPVVDVSGMRTGPYVAAWTEGRALTGEQAIAEALTIAAEVTSLC